MFRNPKSSLVQRADRPESRHVVKRKQCRERTFLFDDVLGQLLPCFEARNRIARLRQIHDQMRIQFQAATFGAVADAAPAWSTVRQSLGTGNEIDLWVAQRL